MFGITSIEDATCKDLEKKAIGQTLTNAFGGKFKVLQVKNSKEILRTKDKLVCLGDLKLNSFQKWPNINKSMLEDEAIEYVIQINGKKRSLISLEKDLDEKTLIEKIKKDKKSKKFLEGSNIIRSIFIKKTD